MLIVPKNKQKKGRKFKTDFEQNAKEQYVKVSDGSEIRVLTFESLSEEPNNIEIFFIPGMMTIFPRWEKVVKELNDRYKIYYIESREKKTSKLTKKAKIDIPQLSDDLIQVQNYLGLNKREYISVSSSLGGTTILEAAAKGELTPVGSVFVGPGSEFHFPKWLIFLLRITPAFILTLFKPLARFILGDIRVDKKNDPDQSRAYKRMIDEADFGRMKKCILNIYDYKGWSILPKVHHRALLVGATHDTLHESDFTKKIADSMPNGTFIDLITNQAAHDTPLVELTNAFVAELANQGPKITEDYIQD